MDLKEIVHGSEEEARVYRFDEIAFPRVKMNLNQKILFQMNSGLQIRTRCFVVFSG